MLIHTFGAYFGLGVSFMLFRKNAKDHSRNSTVYHSDMFAMIGEWGCVAFNGVWHLIVWVWHSMGVAFNGVGVAFNGCGI